MFCPQCRSEFVAAVSFCKGCECDLVDVLPEVDPFESEEAMAQMLADKELQAVMVGQYHKLKEGQRMLAKEHVATVIAGESQETQAQTSMHDRLFLMVAQEDVERVQAFFEAHWQEGLAREGVMLGDEEGGGAAGGISIEQCPACGTDVAPDVDECGECGLFLGGA